MFPTIALVYRSYIESVVLCNRMRGELQSSAGRKYDVKSTACVICCIDSCQLIWFSRPLGKVLYPKGEVETEMEGVKESLLICPSFILFAPPKICKRMRTQSTAIALNECKVWGCSTTEGARLQHRPRRALVSYNIIHFKVSHSRGCPVDAHDHRNVISWTGGGDAV